MPENPSARRETLGEELQHLVLEAVIAGQLPTSASPTQIRGFLRQLGHSCTPQQARALRDRVAARAAEVRAASDAGAGYTLGARLLAARTKLTLSRAQVAQAVSCSESYLAYLEKDARSPSVDMLAALAQVLDVEVDWLRTGNTSPISRRITDLLRLGRYALDHNELGEVERCLEELQDLPGLGRPLRRSEQDEWTLLKVGLLDRQEQSHAAIKLIRPLVDRALAGECDLDPVELGHRYLNVALFGTFLHTLVANPAREATNLAARLLVLDRERARDDRWWRLAATVMNSQLHLGNVEQAMVDGHRWLSELEQTAPDSAPSGVAALRWNLGLCYSEVGRFDEALAEMEAARALLDRGKFLRDGVGIELDYVPVLLAARPHRAAEGIAVLEAVRPNLEKIGTGQDVAQWQAVRAQAELIAGRPAEAEVLATALARDAGVADLHRHRAWVTIGDSRAIRASPENAKAAYDEAAAILRRLDESGYTYARSCRDLADRMFRIGDKDAAIDGYRRALDAINMAEGPGLPPYLGPAESGHPAT